MQPTAAEHVPDIGLIHQQLLERFCEIYEVAYALYEHGHYQKAMDFFHVLTRLQSQNASYWLGLAATQQMLQLYQEALDSYSVAALLDCENPAVHFYAAGCCLSMGDIQKGLQAMTTAELFAQGKPEYASLIVQIAIIREVWSNH